VNVAADKDQIGPERLHHVEFAFGTFEIARAFRVRHCLKVPEGLKSSNR